MNKTTDKVITKWREATEGIAKTFVKKYYPEQRYGIDTFWVGDCVGDVFFIADMFFDLERMLEALELDATFDQLCDYHDAEIERCEKDSEKPTLVNFKNYVKYGFDLKGSK